MLHQFAGCELDTNTRQFRTGGREIPLQPRVFDVLAYLVEHGDRVIGKDELLDALWPGVVVTESSLQRTVSLARAALREAGIEDAIRTHARAGYRFCRDAVATGTPPAAGAAAAADALYREGRWSEALEQYAAADARDPLAADSLERWGTSAQCVGDLARAVAPLERAATAYSARGNCEAAARAMVALARVHFEAQNRAVAKGCLQRAATMLERVELCEQHGHLAWLQSWMASYEGDTAATHEHAQRTVNIGRRLANVDLEAMGLLFCGIALQAAGDSRRGLALQDEAGAAVLTGSVTPLLGGLVYCGLIGGCCNTGDWPRAGQWSESFASWCERNGVHRFSASCLLHRVEVFIARGELERAAAELDENAATIATGNASVRADARRFRGDIHLLHGELDRAETEYRAAYEAGSDPQPGYAVVLQRRGQAAAAVRALRAASERGASWSEMERRPLYLAHMVAIAGQSGDVETAARAIEELEQQPAAWELGTTRAHVLRARAELRLAEDAADEAVPLLRQAERICREADALVEAAAMRLRLAEALWQANDAEGAALELEAAEHLFHRNDVRLFEAECGRLRERLEA